VDSKGAPGSSERFAFGANWKRFLSVVDEERLQEAERSLREMLGAPSLEENRFLDAGCGSGLFSLAAVRLGAERVRSFDYDPASVGSTRALKERFEPEADHWEITEGDVLDRVWTNSLGAYEVVYSWGVLHHTGDLQRALENVAELVTPGGRLFISIYNDQGTKSRLWLAVKRTYNNLPRALRLPFLLAVAGPREALSLAKALAERQPARYIAYWTQYKRRRGMSRWHDIVDWIGGYPFEVAKPETIFDFYRSRGFVLDKLVTCAGGLGCNEFVFSLPRADPTKSSS